VKQAEKAYERTFEETDLAATKVACGREEYQAQDKYCLQ
jgi:hypothetical protein